MWEQFYLSILIAGFGGGVVRGLVGFIKHQFAYKNVYKIIIKKPSLYSLPENLIKND